MATVTHLTLKWSISRARDTDGHNLRTLIDDSTGKRYRCVGGGYDMTGTVLAEWLQEVHQTRLLAIADQAHGIWTMSGDRVTDDSGLYGMTRHERDSRVTVDGACGIESVVRIAKAAGISVQRVYNRAGSEVAMVATEEDTATAV